MLFALTFHCAAAREFEFTFPVALSCRVRAIVPHGTWTTFGQRPPSNFQQTSCARRNIFT